MSGILPPKYGTGPYGIGDPNDNTLRKVEIDVLIPQVIRDKTRKEKCSAQIEEFTKCCKENNFTMIFKCRQENNKLKECLEKWFYDKDFQKECKEIYLQERTEFRKTNIPKKSENIT